MFGKKNDTQHDLEIFIVYDSKTESYRDPLFAINSLDVLREFQNAFEDPSANIKNAYYKNSEDFSLFKVGTYTRKEGHIHSQKPTHVVNFHELKSAALRRMAQNSPQALSPT